MSAATAGGRFWGEVEIPPHLAGRWRLGPLTLWIERRDQEWRLAHRQDRQAPAGRIEVLCPRPPEEPEADAEIVRVAARHVDGRLKLAPALADRSVVVRPENPFRLLADGEVSLFVSTPVWIRVETPEPPEALLELPTARPSDTWFGPSTREGELCYAVHTAARLQLTNLTPLPERAITEVRLRNLAGPFQVERLNLPVHHCSLYAAADGGLWTQGMTMERQSDGQLGEVRFDQPPPAAAGPCERVAEPRQSDRRPALISALSGLLG